MPLFLEHKTNSQHLAIWRIEESEGYFAQKTGLTTDIHHPVKRMEYHASRFLLRHLWPDFPIEKVIIAANGKPFLPNYPVHFSISHSYPYVGAVVSKNTVGLDVQVYRDKILAIKHKFLSEEEQEFIGEDIKNITLAWSSKEAVFKWAETHGIDFRQNMPMKKFELKNGECKAIVAFKHHQPFQEVDLHGKAEEEFAWMMTL